VGGFFGLDPGSVGQAGGGQMTWTLGESFVEFCGAFLAGGALSLPVHRSGSKGSVHELRRVMVLGGVLSTSFSGPTVYTAAEVEFTMGTGKFV